MGGRTEIVFGLLDVENDYLHSFLREHERPQLAEAVGSARDNDQLLCPVELSPRPVVERALVKPAVDPSRHAQVHEQPKPAEGQRIVEGHAASAVGVARQQP